MPQCGDVHRPDFLAATHHPSSTNSQRKRGDDDRLEDEDDHLEDNDDHLEDDDAVDDEDVDED